MEEAVNAGGLQHAVSLGNIEMSSKCTYSNQFARNYDSEDENTSRRKLKHTSSIELYPRPSIYSRGDIREQYCLTERQLTSIERPRRERFFGCLSKRPTPQSFLGTCVGRKVPSEENLSIPFHRYSRYPYQKGSCDRISTDEDMDNSYFRRQPASILSTPKHNTSSQWVSAVNEMSMSHQNLRENDSCTNHCSSHKELSANSSLQSSFSQRTKHVSFARSHTLTSFNNVEQLRLSGRIKPTQSQERLLGGKKPSYTNGAIFGYVKGNIGPNLEENANIVLKTQCKHSQNISNPQHRSAYHMHQYLPTYVKETEAISAKDSFLQNFLIPQDEPSHQHVNYGNYSHQPPPSPEVVVVERKFRNAMKTQATQTEISKEGFANILSLSPRALHKIKVVSQGAQTNGLQNARKLAKSLSEISNSQCNSFENSWTRPNNEHDLVCRTQSEDSPRTLMPPPNEYKDIQFYQPPQGIDKEESYMNHINTKYIGPDKENMNHYKNLESYFQRNSSIKRSQEDNFIYESNSLPRRVCHRYEDEVYSNSLPRREAFVSQDICKHITECSELTSGTQVVFPEELVPPPQEYCTPSKNIQPEQTMRRLSLMDVVEKDRNICTYEDYKAPFRRDDIRRQSMPIYVKVERLIDGFGPRTSFRERRRPKIELIDSSFDEKEILIDFKPNQNVLSKIQSKQRKIHPLESEIPFMNNSIVCDKTENSSDDCMEDDVIENQIEAFYENVENKNLINPIGKENNISRKRSVSLDENDDSPKKPDIVSEPPSPCREEFCANNSTYPSSDSLANDNTRDHSDGLWNESQATVLTAEQREISDSSFNSNILLTPSSKRKNLLLQHQQRSSIELDAMESEEQLVPQQSLETHDFEEKDESIKNYPVKVHPPSISVISSINFDKRELQTAQSSNVPTTSNYYQDQKFLVAPINKLDLCKGNTESECSTNTEDYGTCTETSKRTQGIKSSPTTTSSSSTTQVPVSTQSSQMERTNGGSSFESASSLYSVRGDILSEDIVIQDELLTTNNNIEKIFDHKMSPRSRKLHSPTCSMSSNSSGSYNIETAYKDPAVCNKAMSKQDISKDINQEDRTEEEHKIQLGSISDDEKSEIRYSSSGYYESPQDDEHCNKTRRHRLEEDRKKRKTSMKLDIEKENIRALTSPIKKSQILVVRDQTSTLKQAQPVSPSRGRRFRSKARRPIKKPARIENAQRQHILNSTTVNASISDNKEILIDVSAKQDERIALPRTIDQASNISVKHMISKSTSDFVQKKAKSIESLRSVSPGSDSVFYSEADHANADQHSLCTHCGKEVERNSLVSVIDDDSMEFNTKQQEDIVKPPSDFADSPVTTKTTQRLYKKVDKRYRSEERYGDRGRLYKSRQENIRAKSEERTRENSIRSPQILRPAGSSPCVLPHTSSEINQQVIYRGHYDMSRYTRLTDEDVWSQLDHQTFDKAHDRRPSTDSERNFHSKYQVILHRLVQRRCTLEMYQRQKNNNFRVDKTILVKSDSGEFGFRIHGSKPVVVAAIEPDTPAESSGLEVGDIIISVNGVQVLDKHHTEVVKIAHDGCETLELKVARTIGVLLNEHKEPASPPIHSGYLWRQSGQAKGIPNTKKWVRRWFCMRPDNCLYYYKTEEDTKPVGAMIMAKHNISFCQPDVGRPFAFKIDSADSLPLYVAADSDLEAERWMTILKEAATKDDNWIEKSAHNLYQPPNCILRPDCYGYLMKLGSRWSGWSKRYCVLKDACLFFYQDVKSKSAFGMACLHGYKVCSMSANVSGKKNSFEIVPPEPKLRHYYFCTETEMDKKRWISALEYSIDRWIKSG